MTEGVFVVRPQFLEQRAGAGINNLASLLRTAASVPARTRDACRPRALTRVNAVCADTPVAEGSAGREQAGEPALIVPGAKTFRTRACTLRQPRGRPRHVNVGLLAASAAPRLVRAVPPENPPPTGTVVEVTAVAGIDHGQMASRRGSLAQ